jgi:Short C-terminal domain
MNMKSETDYIIHQSSSSPGGGFDLPTPVLEAAVLRNHAVVAWTKLDPALEDKVGSRVCVQSFGLFLFLPCFWPHLLVIWPCLWAGMSNAENTIKSQYWILTERELKVVTMDHFTCCVPISSSGTQVKTIPLENITDCGVVSVGKGCMNQCYDVLPTIYVDTASSGTTSREAVGVGLANHDSFIRKILDQRDVVKGVSAPSTFPTATAMVEPMQRGADVVVGSATERLKHVKELYDNGLISSSEYEKKRQDIIAAI